MDICREYYDNGQISYEVPCRDYDQRFEGEMRMYYPSGDLKAIRQFVEGKEQDTARYYHEGGELKRLDPMVDGLLNGKSKIFRPNGTLAKESHYELGLKQGEERIYHPSGDQIRELYTYQNDEQFGPYARFQDNGNPVVKGELYYGFRFAKWSNYRSDGSLFNEFTYRHDRKSGPFVVYRQNGVPYLTGHFTDDILDGEILYYNNDGAIVKREKWVAGVAPDGSPSTQELIGLKALDGSRIVIKNDFVEVQD